MFIRKRERISTTGKINTTYQLLETYREAGKVKQRVICNLMGHATPEEALEYAKTKVEMLKNSRIRMQEEKGKCSFPQCYRYSYWEKRLNELNNVVSRLSRRHEIIDRTKVM